MIWLLFTNKIREAFKIPKLFTVFKDDDNGKMLKFTCCSMIILLMGLFMLSSCAIVATVSNPVTIAKTAIQAVKSAVSK